MKGLGLDFGGSGETVHIANGKGPFWTILSVLGYSVSVSVLWRFLIIIITTRGFGGILGPFWTIFGGYGGNFGSFLGYLECFRRFRRVFQIGSS